MGHWRTSARGLRFWFEPEPEPRDTWAVSMPRMSPHEKQLTRAHRDAMITGQSTAATFAAIREHAGMERGHQLLCIAERAYELATPYQGTH